MKLSVLFVITFCCRKQETMMRLMKPRNFQLKLIVDPTNVLTNACKYYSPLPLKPDISLRLLSGKHQTATGSHADLK